MILSLGCGRRHNADAQAMQRVSSEPAREELRGVATQSLQVEKLMGYDGVVALKIAEGLKLKILYVM